MSFLEGLDSTELRHPSPAGVTRVTDLLVALTAGAVAVFLGVSRPWVDVIDVRTAGRFVVVASLLLVGLVGYHHLIERRQMASMRRAAEKELPRAKDRFIANVSHGLRTPLTGIVGFAHVLETSIVKRTDLESVKTILGEAAELSRIVDDLVVAARLDSETLTVQPQDVSFADQLEPVLQYLELVGGPVAVDCPDVNIRVDPGLFRQVLRNLLANAHRHGRPQVMIQGRVDHDRFVCHVVDHGSGVPAEIQSRLFNRFNHRDSGITGHVGLGLAVVQELSERMGCQVGYRRIRGQTHFVVSTPLAEVQQATTTRIAVTAERLVKVRDRLVRVPA